MSDQQESYLALLEDSIQNRRTIERGTPDLEKTDPAGKASEAADTGVDIDRMIEKLP